MSGGDAVAKLGAAGTSEKGAGPKDGGRGTSQVGVALKNGDAGMNDGAGVLKAVYANAPDVLADFGLKPKKARTPLTVAAKAAAAAKRAATRAVRHVMGSVQRKAVKGDVTGVVVTPVFAPQPVTTTSNGPSPPAPTAGGATTVPTGHTA